MSRIVPSAECMVHERVTIDRVLTAASVHDARMCENARQSSFVPLSKVKQHSKAHACLCCEERGIQLMGDPVIIEIDKACLHCLTGRLLLMGTCQDANSAGLGRHCAFLQVCTAFGKSLQHAYPCLRLCGDFGVAQHRSPTGLRMQRTMPNQDCQLLAYHDFVMTAIRKIVARATIRRDAHIVDCVSLHSADPLAHAHSCRAQQCCSGTPRSATKPPCADIFLRFSAERPGWVAGWGVDRGPLVW